MAVTTKEERAAVVPARVSGRANRSAYVKGFKAAQAKAQRAAPYATVSATSSLRRYWLEGFDAAESS